ncbi:unnamed protein product [Dicrocoelium dendriticum]|nr:unnamed protein product [Dicrocoelium dendriticum]
MDTKVHILYSTRWWIWTAVQLEELSRLYNRTDSFSSNQTEAAFAAVCRQLYKQMKHLPNSKAFYSGFIHSILNIRPKVWAASLIAILVISMVGLLGVSVVPLVQKVFFNEVIQYLVAVAVGTLTGDAMLHLIPHAISVGGHDHETPGERQSDTEKMSVYKGLVALGGVYFFFMAEKTLGFVSEYRAEKKLEEEDRKRAMEHPRRHTDVRRLSAFRPSLIPGTLGVPGQQRRISQLDPSVCRRASRALSLVNEDIMTTGLTSKAMRSIDILYRYAEEDAQKDEQISEPGTDDEGTTTIHLPVPTEIARLLDGSDTSLSSKKNDTSLRVPKILFAVDQGEDHTSEHFAKDEKKPAEPNEGNGSERKHGHGHSHKVPGSVASVAWMVILGDGLHNFTDGMAIGE